MKKYQEPIITVVLVDEPEQLMAASQRSESKPQDFGFQDVGEDDVQHVIQLSKRNSSLPWDNDGWNDEFNDKWN